eukprot:COSAG06_NODE_12103_length_1423_cov_15.696375_1_plen_166_part_10
MERSHLADASLIAQVGVEQYDAKAAARAAAGPAPAEPCVALPRPGESERCCAATATMRTTAVAAASAETRAVRSRARVPSDDAVPALALPGAVCAAATAATACMLRPTSRLCTRDRIRTQRARPRTSTLRRSAGNLGRRRVTAASRAARPSFTWYPAYLTPLCDAL